MEGSCSICEVGVSSRARCCCCCLKFGRLTSFFTFFLFLLTSVHFTSCVVCRVELEFTIYWLATMPRGGPENAIGTVEEAALTTDSDEDDVGGHSIAQNDARRRSRAQLLAGEDLIQHASRTIAGLCSDAS